MTIKALDKQQCVIRLDEHEICKLAAIQRVTGLSKTGVIRKLIRDFNINKNKIATDIILSQQISESIFSQIPEEPVTIIPNFDASEGFIVVAEDGSIKDPDVVIGFAYHPSIIPSADLEFYQHDIIYLNESVLFRCGVYLGESGTGVKSKTKNYRKQIAECRMVRKRLQQIFVV